MSMSRDVLLGVIIGAQGLKGEVKVKTFTQSPQKMLPKKKAQERAAANAKAAADAAEAAAAPAPAAAEGEAQA